MGFDRTRHAIAGAATRIKYTGALSSLGSTGNNVISINTLAMVYYPFEDPGSGAILVTSTFTDWGASHGQTSTTELRVVRDLLTFAKNIHQPIPLYNLDDNSSPQVQLDIDVENTTETPATKIIMTAYTPGRTKASPRWQTSKIYGKMFYLETMALER